MATVKSRCTTCRQVSKFELASIAGVELPPGISEAYCLTCDQWKVVITSETLAEPFFAPPPKRGRK